jgi:hypothetical protein
MPETFNRAAMLEQNLQRQAEAIRASNAKITLLGPITTAMPGVLAASARAMPLRAATTSSRSRRKPTSRTSLPGAALLGAGDPHPEPPGRAVNRPLMQALISRAAARRLSGETAAEDHRMRAGFVVCLGLLAACAGPQPGVKPVAAGGSRADGIVTMASSGTIWNPVGPDWRVAQDAAGRRCRAWGYDGAGAFAGWQEACRQYDLHGRCVRTTVTRFYPCTGSG